MGVYFKLGTRANYRKKDGSRLSATEYRKRRKREIYFHISLLILVPILLLTGILVLVHRIKLGKEASIEPIEVENSTEELSIIDTVINDVEIEEENPYLTRSADSESFFDGYDFKIVELESGSPYNTTSAGIIKGRETKEDVKEVFQWLITDFSKYDKEVYLPANLFKNQEIKIKNYPKNVKDANMKSIQDAKVKEELSKKWEKVNG